MLCTSARANTRLPLTWRMHVLYLCIWNGYLYIHTYIHTYMPIHIHTYTYTSHTLTTWQIIDSQTMKTHFIAPKRPSIQMTWLFAHSIHMNENSLVKHVGFCGLLLSPLNETLSKHAWELHKYPWKAHKLLTWWLVTWAQGAFFFINLIQYLINVSDSRLFDRMEVSFPPVPNLEEVDFGTALNQQFAAEVR